jgi:hypothetical protein
MLTLLSLCKYSTWWDQRQCGSCFPIESQRVTWWTRPRFLSHNHSAESTSKLTHRSADPVSKSRLSVCAGVPMPISARYIASFCTSSAPTCPTWSVPTLFFCNTCCMRARPPTGLSVNCLPDWTMVLPRKYGPPLVGLKRYLRMAYKYDFVPDFW